MLELLHVIKINVMMIKCYSSTIVRIVIQLHGKFTALNRIMMVFLGAFRYLLVLHLILGLGSFHTFAC